MFTDVLKQHIEATKKERKLMKKRIFAILLSALLMASATACNQVPDNIPENETESTTEGTVGNTNEIEEGTSENAPGESEQWYTIACNGVYHNLNVKYSINQDNEFILHIEDWDEYKQISCINHPEITSNDPVFSIALNDEFALLFFKPYGQTTLPLQVIRLIKGTEEAVVNQISIDEAIYLNDLYCNFISNQVGYLFVFEEGAGGFPSGHTQLNSILKTNDGGNTWNSLAIEHFPLINLKNRICFSKMLNENIGIVSGRYWADDYDFCERTLLTIDGGLHWVNIAEMPQMYSLCQPEVTEFVQDGESYILTVRHKISETDYEYAKYKSLDMNAWVRID